MDYNFGEKVEQLLTESGKTKKSLYDYLKMTANGFDGMIKNNSISAIRLAQIADYFGKPVAYFYGQPVVDSKKTDNPISYGDQVIEKLSDELKRMFEQELKEKNQQIAGLQKNLDSAQRMLEAVLGKSEGDSDQPASILEKAQADAKRAHLRLGVAMMLPHVFPAPLQIQR